MRSLFSDELLSCFLEDEDFGSGPVLDDSGATEEELLSTLELDAGIEDELLTGLDEELGTTLDEDSGILLEEDSGVLLEEDG